MTEKAFLFLLWAYESKVIRGLLLILAGQLLVLVAVSHGLWMRWITEL